MAFQKHRQNWPRGLHATGELFIRPLTMDFPQDSKAGRADLFRLGWEFWVPGSGYDQPMDGWTNLGAGGLSLQMPTVLISERSEKS